MRAPAEGGTFDPFPGFPRHNAGVSVRVHPAAPTTRAYDKET